MSNLKDTLFKLGTGFHRAVFSATNGRVFGNAGGMPVLILHTVGRKSGQERQTMLTAPIVEDGKVVLVASYGGDARHPAWYLNLVAEPDVRVTMAGRTGPMHARVVDEDEKAELWPRIVAAYKGYAGYQAKTDRDIPVVVLTPTG